MFLFLSCKFEHLTVQDLTELWKPKKVRQSFFKLHNKWNYTPVSAWMAESDTFVSLNNNNNVKSWMGFVELEEMLCQSYHIVNVWRRFKFVRYSIDLFVIFELPKSSDVKFVNPDLKKELLFSYANCCISQFEDRVRCPC